MNANGENPAQFAQRPTTPADLEGSESSDNENAATSESVRQQHADAPEEADPEPQPA
jgi:hypothetical protein